MEKYFNIRYEFDRDAVDRAIDERLTSPGADYICVADGVVAENVQRMPEYEAVVNGGMFSICDSGYVPLYLKLIYGIDRGQYCGHELFTHIVNKKKYRMMFLGTSDKVLSPLKKRLVEVDSRIASMQFEALPFAEAEHFDFERIAEKINADKPDIIWVSLGAPKQEKFMHYLKPYINHGILISVGAVFKFVSGIDERRAPQWMVKCKLEFLYRIFMEPRKQSRRAWSILHGLPRLLSEEIKRKKTGQS